MVVAGADSAIRIIDVYDHVPGDKARERPITPSIKYVTLLLGFLDSAWKCGESNLLM